MVIYKKLLVYLINIWILNQQLSFVFLEYLGNKDLMKTCINDEINNNGILSLDIYENFKKICSLDNNITRINISKGLISVDKGNYLLLYRIYLYDPLRKLTIHRSENNDAMLQYSGDNNLIIYPLLLKISNSDINKIKKLTKVPYSLRKNIERRKMLQIEYSIKPLLGEPEKGKDLIIYKNHSLISHYRSRILNGMNIKQLSRNSMKQHISDKLAISGNLHIGQENWNDEGFVKYFKFGKGSFGEVWRGLAFTKSIESFLGYCNESELSLLRQNKNRWKRGKNIDIEFLHILEEILQYVDKYKKSICINFQTEKVEEVSVVNVVMKRMLTEIPSWETKLSAIREIFFGILLYCMPHITRFLHVFEEENLGTDLEVKSEIWLVYRYEGISLYSLLFMADENGKVIPSKFWWRHIKNRKNKKLLKCKNKNCKKANFQDLLKEFMYQLMKCLAIIHSMGIVHRDIKPSNILISVISNRSNLNSYYLRLADWGSAILEKKSQLLFENFPMSILNKLYGNFGPSYHDETEGYQPPEVQFNSFIYNPTKSKMDIFENTRLASYDMWSAGVIMLQIIWGNLQVFSVLNDDTKFQHLLLRANRYIENMLNSNLSNISVSQADNLKKDIMYRLALMRLCLLDSKNDISWVQNILNNFLSTIGTNSSSVLSGISRSCTDEEFSNILKQFDPSGIGLDSLEAMKFLKSLLNPSSKDRITAKSALQHAYFKKNRLNYE
ncbi:hypothetical protein ACR3K2_03340 [Cryptosporidium serpentis]